MNSVVKREEIVENSKENICSRTRKLAYESERQNKDRKSDLEGKHVERSKRDIIPQSPYPAQLQMERRIITRMIEILTMRGELTEAEGNRAKYLVANDN